MTTNYLIVVKDVDSDATSVLDLSTFLEVGAEITDVALLSLAPTTNPALTLTEEAVVGEPQKWKIDLSGGITDTTYAIKLTVTPDVGDPVVVNVAVQVQDSANIYLRTRNPHAFQTLIDSVEAGEAVVGNASFTMDPGTTTAGSYVRWELLNNKGEILSQGNAFDYVIENTSLMTRLSAVGLVNVPSDLQSTHADQSYQVRWVLVSPTAKPMYLFENIKVIGKTTVALGAQDTVEVKGHVAQLEVVLPSRYEKVAIGIYKNNTELVTSAPTFNEPVATGHMYGVQVATVNLDVMLDPYTILWQYSNPNNATAPAGSFTEHSRMWVISPSMIEAMKYVENSLMKARTTLLGFSDILFDQPTILNHLARGRDMFNGAGGKLTTFTMINATGAVRELWMKYSEISALEAQGLAEAEKAFNFSGQAISLDRDVASAYREMASTIRSEVDATITQLKTNLIRKGISGGDGDVTNVGRNPTTAIVGRTLTPARWGWHQQPYTGNALIIR